MKKRYLIIPNFEMSSDLEIRTDSLFHAWILYMIKYKKQAVVWDTAGWIDQSHYRPWLQCGYPADYSKK
ncbi:hypothetical protein AMD27_16280 (plasmid) [Acinetobacter sp. TGL-Y2]|uniref:hypothetical protein n=1 Tax=Acinetobacter sp. TGL-Y2 TaxID=1407071 RepID=UPI0007A679BE|nr:hypothetical protein [Acinetobacter sp. TGL-Y2]AMW80474.1 hypothetical protein AMD27_16280 [Acinetobacter sp. TGL-Y2]